MPTRSRAMAIPRMFNCNTPFTIVTGESELSFLGNEDAGGGGGGGEEDEKRDSLVQAIGPHLSRVMQHGTAKHLEAPREDNCVSIVAQAQSEDIQEFSPSNTQCLYTQTLQRCRSLGRDAVFLSDSEDVDGAPVLHQHLQRKQRRKPRRRRSREDGEERPIIRGLWVQEVDWLKSADRETLSSVTIIPPPPQFTDAAPCSLTDEDSCRRRSEEEEDDDDEDEEEEESSSGSNDRGDSDCSSVRTHQCESDSSGAVEAAERAPALLAASRSPFDLMQVSGFDGSLGRHEANARRPVIGWDEAPREELGGKVTQVSKELVSAGLRGPFRRILDGWTSSSPDNEGLLFHHQLQPGGGGGYREGQHYGVLHHIQNGAYGDVFCVRDRTTGFKCAAKKVPVSRFSGEEVSAWSAVTSPRVVELFGAVREGPSVVLFMDLKPGCLGQLLKEAGWLQEDLALHYLHQTLGALEHLHRRKVLHLDVKADNVLLSADCRDTFLCDFGLAQTLDDGERADGGGGERGVFRGGTFPGTETHMAPEVARGDRLDAKADVWSSCCMLLHMLNGCQPWIRFYSPPLCLQIVNEPPPLWEVPSNCNNFTASVFRAGLQKDPERRASAKELRKKTTKALRAVGGLSLWSIKAACETLRRVRTQNQDAASSPAPVSPSKASPPAMNWVSPWRMTAVDEDSDQDPETEELPGGSDSEPKSLRDDFPTEDWHSGSDSEVDLYTGEEWLKAEREYEGDWEEEGDEEEAQEEQEEDWDSPESTEYLRALRGLFPLLQKGHMTQEPSWGSEEELEYLRDGVVGDTTIGTPSPEPRDDPPSCFSCSETSQIDVSEDDSDRSSDDLSSGVFSSCNSQTDAALEWTAPSTQPSSHCFEGVDVWIENVQGECLRIRERRRVKVGHVAIGISDQVSGKTFTLETLDRKTVSFDQEIKDSGLWLRCVPAPDRCQRWRWRVRDGKLELRE